MMIVAALHTPGMDQYLTYALVQAGKVDWRKTADAAKTAREIDEVWAPHSA